jgi:thioredoxin 1
MFNQKGNVLLIILIVVAVVAVSGGYWYSQRQQPEMPIDAMAPVAVAERVINNTALAETGSYVDYSESAYQEALGTRRVLFFHAAWCPTCKTANAEFAQGSIPEGVTLLKTDYDIYDELKKKYGITYQHTFVEVDEDGNEIQKWSGGGIEELRERIS